MGAKSVEVKVDFEKAYDRVSWGILQKILTWLGASPLWCSWIEQCIANAKVTAAPPPNGLKPKRDFEWASGLKINRSKSELFYLGRTIQQGERLAEILGCKLGAFPTRYLGLPLTNRRLCKSD